MVSAVSLPASGTSVQCRMAGTCEHSKMTATIDVLRGMAHQYDTVAVKEMTFDAPLDAGLKSTTVKLAGLQPLAKGQRQPATE
jgi:hypothetical protein